VTKPHRFVARRPRRTKGKVFAICESQKVRFSRVFFIGSFAFSPRVFKFTFTKREFPERFCRFLFLQNESVEMEGKIWAFPARFARENRLFVPLNFPVISSWRFWLFFRPSFRSAIAAPKWFATRALSKCKIADRGI
jgi:hypothetical protein